MSKFLFITTIFSTLFLLSSVSFAAANNQEESILNIDSMTAGRIPVMATEYNCTSSTPASKVHSNLFYDIENVTNSLWERELITKFPENYEHTNRTIVLSVDGRDALYELNDETGKLRFKGYCGDAGVFCYAGDNTVVRKNMLQKFNANTGKLENICTCSDIGCGCDELNLFIRTTESGKDAVYGKKREGSDEASFLGYCNDLVSTCKNKYLLTDMVFNDGIRYRYDAGRDILAPQCFCTTAGCKCPGYNPPTPAKPAVRPVRKKDKVIVYEEVWEVCECWEPDCHFCGDAGAIAEGRAAMESLQSSGTYYDENGQARSGGSGFKDFGKALGLARGVLSFIK